MVVNRSTAHSLPPSARLPRLCVHLACLSVCPSVLSGQEPIRDNSFLIEEAYNQEPRVVQHINAFVRPRSGGEWLYAFTQEWPVGSARHQISFTLPVQHLSGLTRVADIALNYRYQLVGPGGRTAVAPRLSLFLPTGDYEQRVGAGAWGVQVNLPVSVAIGARLATHWNAGATLTPSARDAQGQEATIRAFNFGASAILLIRPVNLVLEAVWIRGEEVRAPGSAVWREELFINPGVRWAYDFANGLQIVPGLSFPIGVGASRGEDGAVFYLSFEHGF